MPSIKRWIPNIISLTRLVISPLGAYLLWKGELIISFIILLSAAFSDFLDGFLARKWRVQSTLGKILDPTADKAAILSYLFSFYLSDNTAKPSELIFILYLLKELVILLGTPLMVLFKWVPEPNMWGKGATYSLFTYLLGLYLVSFGTVPPGWIWILEVISATFVLSATLTYLAEGVSFLLSLK